MADTSRNIVLALLVVGVAVAVFYMMDPTFGGLLGKREGFQAMEQAMGPSAQPQPMAQPQPILPPNNPASVTGMQVEKFQSGPEQKKELDGLLAASKALGEALAKSKGKAGAAESFMDKKKEESFMNYEKKKETFMGATGHKKTEGFQNQMPEAAQPANCYPKNQLAPEELLPMDKANQWAAVNPTGTGDISGKNFLSAGAMIGVNTVGQSLRNANQQLRSEPPCPQVQVSIWNQSTIEPDLQRKPLEGF